MKLVDLPGLIQAPKDQGYSHEYFWAHFSANEKKTGGPDPQIDFVGSLVKHLPVEERLWAFICYAALYNVPGGYVLWKHWPWERMCAEPDAFTDWLKTVWPNLPWRREARARRSIPKLTRAMLSGAEWVPTALNSNWWGTDNYEAAWDSADHIYGFGRYVNLKLLEGARRHCDAGVELQDLRAAGGWSPKATLALLYPGHARALLGPDTRDNCRIADLCARFAQETLAERYGVHATMFEIQVLCCEYRESYFGLRQYPGRSIDSELGYQHKIEKVWPVDELSQARSEIFPHESLGEIQGWDSPRKELGEVNNHWGYVWSDLTYNWHASKEDLAHPVRWELSDATS